MVTLQTVDDVNAYAIEILHTHRSILYQVTRPADWPVPIAYADIIGNSEDRSADLQP